MSEPVIQLDDVSFAYTSGRVVLEQASCALHRGERLGLQGANGSGKTTLLQLIVGLHKPTAGRIACFGTPRATEKDFRDVRKRVGLLFQDSDDQLFCPTVQEDVAFGPLNLGKTRAEVRELVRSTLELVTLSGYEERITYKLSGGEKRLVALAAVLAMQPEVLLLDEPLTGLDEAHEKRISEILLSLPQSMIVVSHNAAFLARITTRSVRLQQGRVTSASNAEV